MNTAPAPASPPAPSAAPDSRLDVRLIVGLWLLLGVVAPLSTLLLRGPLTLSNWRACLQLQVALGMGAPLLGALLSLVLLRGGARLALVLLCLLPTPLPRAALRDLREGPAQGRIVLRAVDVLGRLGRAGEGLRYQATLEDGQALRYDARVGVLKVGDRPEATYLRHSGALLEARMNGLRQAPSQLEPVAPGVIVAAWLLLLGGGAGLWLGSLRGNPLQRRIAQAGRGLQGGTDEDGAGWRRGRLGAPLQLRVPLALGSLRGRYRVEGLGLGASPEEVPLLLDDAAESGLAPGAAYREVARVTLALAGAVYPYPFGAAERSTVELAALGFTVEGDEARRSLPSDAQVWVHGALRDARLAGVLLCEEAVAPRAEWLQEAARRAAGGLDLRFAALLYLCVGLPIVAALMPLV